MGIRVTGGVKVPQGKFSVYTVAPPPPPPSGNELWAWGGYNSRGQLGLGNTTNYSSPVQVGSLTNWASVSIGRFHTVALKTDGALWSWGQSTSGRLGNGTSTGYNKSSPVQIGALTDWASVSAGNTGTHAIKTDGTLWGWGSNFWGYIGDGTNINRSSPVQIGALTDWASVSDGQNQTLALKTNGSIWTWGYNFEGNAGLGDDIRRSSPVQVGSLTDWASIGVGNFHDFAVKTNGTLWAWGRNNLGQIGDGTVINRSSPVQIGSLTTWSSVRNAGRQHTMAVKTDGTVWGWGDNSAGRLGDGTTTNRSSPVQVGSLTDWASVGAGGKHSVAIKTNGTLWSWGDNTYEGDGALGLGDTSNRNSPVQIGSLTTWTSINAAQAHNLALKTPS